MGILDFLKITVRDKKKPAATQRRPAAAISAIEFDGKSFPIAVIDAKGFVATGFDGSLIKGQTARITVRVSDAFGNFTFSAAVGINEVKGDKVAGGWSMLAPEVETTLRQYVQNRKRKTGR